jgi:GNAT superfamily N-acetyltransferase
MRCSSRTSRSTPPHQGTGVGRRMLRFAEDQARRAGFTATSLYTNEAMHENIDLYTHIGYHEIDRRTDHGYRRVFMRKPLT